MNIHSQLLFLHGHVADQRLAAGLSAPQPTPLPALRQQGSERDTSHDPNQWRHVMKFFKSLVYLGGLESIDSRIGEEEEAFGQTYGNRLASERTFGKPAPKPFHRRVAPIARNTPAPFECVVGGCG